MGTSMAFYLIENRGLPRRTLQERMDTFRPQALADQRDMREKMRGLFKAFMSEEVFEVLQRGMRTETGQYYSFSGDDYAGRNTEAAVVERSGTGLAGGGQMVSLF